MKLLQIFAISMTILFSGGSTFAQNNNDAAFNVFGDMGVNLKYSTTSSRDFSIRKATATAIWDADLSEIQIVKGGTPIFPASTNTFYKFDSPVKLHAEASIPILKAIFKKDPGILDTNAISATIKGNVSSDGVKRFIDSCFADPSTSKIAKATKAALAVIDVFGDPKKPYTLEIEVLIKDKKTTVTEYVYDGNTPIFINPNTFDTDITPYLEKLIKMLDLYDATKK